MELNREQIVKQMQEWSDNMCENACLKGESLNGKVHTCEICFPNTVKNALSLIKELTEENERLKFVEFTCGFIKPHKVLECPIFDEIVRTRADTVRKMQELIAEHATNGYPRKVRLDVVDQIAKEMLDGKQCTDCKHFVGCERVCHGVCDYYEVAR